MCGICGIAWQDKKLVERMKQRICHRGPDADGTYADKEVSLGHLRLAIIGLSEKGKQPMQYHDMFITFNGEIYNYQELQHELEQKGYSFTTGTDTEILLAGYEAWGEKMLHKLNGMFAFCIYDKKKKELFLARDRFGIKPLYYTETEKGLAFSSELTGLHDIIAKNIDKEALREFFTFRFTLGERTLMQDVKKLLPGTYLVYDLKQRSGTKGQWYQFKPARIPKEKLQDDQWCKEELRRRLKKAVERRMVADVPVSTFLSGGIDSSTITFFAREQNNNLNTFSMGFETTNELPYARMVSQTINTNHHEILLDKKDILKHIDKMMEHMDEPIGDPGFLPMLVLSQEVAKKNKVVLSGDGGDEVLTGYDRYKLFHYGWGLRHFALLKTENDIVKRLHSMRHKDAYEAFIEIIRLFEKDELEAFDIKEADARNYWNDKLKRNGKSLTRTEIAQVFDIGTLLPGDFFMKADKMSSAFGLEQRVPFLDHELVEFCFALPMKKKLHWWNEKKILKEIMMRELPEISKRRKHGFNVPIDYWFKNVLGKKLKLLLDKSTHNLYRKEHAYTLLERIKEKGNNYKENFVLAQKLWSLLIFELWYEKNIGKK